MPDQKILFTISPQRFSATFRGISPLVAHASTKANLRAALDEFLRERSDQLNETYFYFPAYEIVQELFVDPFAADNIHLREECAEFIVDLFASIYVADIGDVLLELPPSQHDQLLRTISLVEAKAVALQAVCDERLQVIEALDLACRERLALIERLDAELRQRRRNHPGRNTITTG